MSEADKAVPPKAGPESSAYPRAKVGQDDAGHTVTGAADEPMSGTVADVTDGDRRHAHHHKHK